MTDAALARVLDGFAREAARNRLADTYLFLGPSRARLREAARRCASLHLQAHGPVEEHAECVVLDPELLGARSLKVEHIAIRGEGSEPCLERALRYRPMGSGRRAVLLYETDRMNADAQAALLKTTEEPPEGTVLFLTAADLSTLLPALRSRCRTWRVAPPPREELDRLAAAAGIEPGAWQVLASGLGPEAALALPEDLREELLERHGGFLRWLEAAGDTRSWLATPAGGSLAEQRAAGEVVLSAVLGWSTRAMAETGPEAALVLDRLVRRLLAGIRDLRGNVTPDLVFQDLAAGGLGGALPRAMRPSRNAIS